jgi:hypothetical protein
MKFSPHIVILLALASLALVAGCQQSVVMETDVPAAQLTQAYMTVEAHLANAASSSPQATITPSPDQESTITPLPTTPRPTATASAPTPTPTDLKNCDRAAPGFPKIDVEIDDDTHMQPGQRFTKVWRLENSGSCPWTKDYRAVWFYGARLGEIISVPLGGQIEPGDSVDIYVDMVAPTNPGVYQSNWMLQNAAGDLFGIGPTGSSPFWTRINVVQPPTVTASATETQPPTETPDLTHTPTSTPAPTPIIAAAGELSLLPESGVDLDTGEQVGLEGADFGYRFSGSIYWLTPENGAQIGIYGNSEPWIDACLNANTSTAPIAAGSLNPGIYLCYTTDQNRPGWLYLKGLDEETFQIEIQYLTWQHPSGE